MQLWRQLVRQKGNVPPMCVIDMNDVARYYLKALPHPVCPSLSLWHVIHMVPAHPQSAGTIWRDALQAGTLPMSISFEAFSEALSRLAPLFLSINMAVSSKNCRDAMVSWQPWVSQEWRDRYKRNGGGSAASGRDALEAELCSVVPSYFVPSRLVQGQIRRRESGVPASTTLEWQQLMTPPLASLLEWSSDYGVVRLSTHVSGGAVAAANALYGLKAQPDMFHKGLNALALVLPTFDVFEERVRRVYKTHFVDSCGIYYSEFGPQFTERFPDACALMDHPELQFALQRDGSGRVMLHPLFLHANRGVPDSLYSVAPPARCNPPVKDISTRPHVCNFLHMKLPYISTSGDEVILRCIQQERLLGMQCVVNEDEDRFSFSLATARGDVAFFECTVSSLYRLSTSGIQNGGLPVEVADALASPKVVKVIAIESACREERITEDVRLMSFLRQRLNIDVQTVCSLWRWALFVGFPFQPLPALSVSFYHRLLARLGVTVVPSMPTALLAAMCASRLLAFHELEGYCFDASGLHQMLPECGSGDDDTYHSEEVWLVRNLDMRIRRYGKVPLKGASLQAHRLLLRSLSSLYGPEVCTFDREPKLPPTLTIHDEKSFDKQPMVEEKADVENAQGSYDDDERAFIDVFCPLPDAACGGEQREAKAGMEVLSTLDENKMPQDSSGKPKKREAGEGTERVFAPSGDSATSEVINTFPGSDVSHKDEEGNTSTQPQFILSPPSIRHDRYQNIRLKSCSTSQLPPPFSFPRASAVMSSHESLSRSSSFPAQRTSSAAIIHQPVDDVKIEKELIGCLTREILHESRKGPVKGPQRVKADQSWMLREDSTRQD